MIKLIIISHVFWQQSTWKRWRLLTQLYTDIDVTLLAPHNWIEGNNSKYTWGMTSQSKGTAFGEERFRVELIDMRQNRLFDWLSIGLIRKIKNIKPDIIYYIGNEMQDPLVETIIARNMFASRAKLALFSMRSGVIKEFKSDGSLKKRLLNGHGKFKWNMARKNCDAVFCHYPAARAAFILEGFTKSSYINTQIGVDAQLYIFDELKRKEIREKYALGDSFVFGSATRFSADKGLTEILNALPDRGGWRYLMLGSGTDKEIASIKSEISRLGLQDKVILPGFIHWNEMPAYFSAMDCLLHVPRTTPQWVETFSLAIVQAMSTGLPIIGNTSGSVPYQLGENGVIIPEGDIQALRTQMKRLLDDPAEALRIGELMRQRVLNCFDIAHLTHCFYHTIKDILDEKFDPQKIDSTNFNPCTWEVRQNKSRVE